MEMTAVEFKSKCLELMDDIKDNHEEVIITKEGKPVAKLVPIEVKSVGSSFGFMKNSVKINGDIINPIDEEWSVEG
jgi:prevent-host-death family protein